MWLRVYLIAVTFGCSLAEADGTPRRTAQVPFVADAVGNALPPPSEVPSKVGSPSSLLTPDRYEFYTFDESGELIKRLMTLEEIQAIVAAGDGNDGHMVTFAQDEKSTIAFNFSQPPFTKVHSVVTNVQNVLKSQMEAQKNNPPNSTTFDTPDVSNSWSMILPSIFGNTGVEIVPDKLTSSFGTPETDTIDFGTKPIHSTDIVISKEDPDSDNIENSKTYPTVESKEVQSNNQLASKSTTTTTKTETTTTTTTITPKPTTTTTTMITLKPNTTTTTTTTANPATTTTNEPITTAIVLNQLSKLSDNNSYEKVNTSEPIQKFVPRKPETASKKPVNSDKNSHISAPTPTKTSYVEITRPKITLTPTTEKPLTIYRVTSSIINGFPPTKRTADSVKIATTTIRPLVSVTTYRPSSNIFSSTTEITKVLFTLPEFDGTKNGNGTTLTTQSVSPSTAHTTTDVISSHDNVTSEDDETKKVNSSPDKFKQELIPSFDVAQSISQIASDLEKGFVIHNNDEGLEAEVKYNNDLDLPDVTTTPKSTIGNSNSTFIKISTSDPQGVQTVNYSQSSPQGTRINIFAKPIVTYTTESIKSVNTNISTNTTEADSQVDAILTESMSDLLSQVVDQIPNNVAPSTESNNRNTITESTLNNNNAMVIITTSNISKNHTINADNATKNIPAIVNSISNSINNHIFLKNDTITEIQDSVELFTPLPTTSSTQQSPKEEYYKESAEIGKESSKSDKISSTEIISPVSSEIPNTTKLSVPTTVYPIPIMNNRIGPENESTLYNNKFSNDQNKTTIENNIELLQNQIANVTVDKLKVPTENGITEDQSTESLKKQQQKVNDSKKKIQKVNIDDKEYTDSTKNDSWKLVPTVLPPRENEIPILNEQSNSDGANITPISEFANGFNKEINLNGSNENQGLQVTVKNLGEDVYQFIDLCNELAFRYWNSAVENIDKRRSFILSPYSITSMLAMMFMGARGATSGEMNDILKLDDMVTFNPHFILKNISDSIETNPESGVAVSVFVRELYSDRNQGKLLTFYKERSQHFYNGHVEEINFKLINDIIRRRTNLLVKRYTWGKINEYIKTNDITMKPPLAAFSANVLETDCTGSSVEGRDGEMYFVVSPSVRQRRLVPVPAVVYRAGFLAGYDPVLDATAAAVGNASSVVSTVLLMPGQQGNTVHAGDLEKLEKKLLNSIPTAPEWYRLLRTLLPRPGLELQIPRFSQRSIFNVSAVLRGMGLRDIFDPVKADMGGLNGPSKDLYLSDMIETSTFVTCGEGPVGEQHHIEEYPELRDASRKRRNSRFWDEPRDYQRSFHDPHDLGAALLPLHLRPRQARLPSRSAPPQPARLKFDRPFLYFVRHNPSGIILYVGRYNPRLLP